MKHISWYTSLNRMIQNVNVGKAEGCTDHDLSRSEHEVRGPRGSGAPRQLQFLVSLGPETWCEMSAQQHSFEAAWIELESRRKSKEIRGSRSRFYSNPKWCCGDTMVITMLILWWFDGAFDLTKWWSFVTCEFWRGWVGTPQSCLIFSRVMWHRWLLSVLKMQHVLNSQNSQCSAPRVWIKICNAAVRSVRTVQQVLLDPWNLENQPGLEQSLQRIAATLHWFFGILWYSLVFFGSC